MNDKFVDEIINAQKVEIRDFEKEIYFEGCLPIEILAQRGKDFAIRPNETCRFN
jgi:methylenetetrahydrofolate--tRNA-(uracil-5-)-methyltransferase